MILLFLGSWRSTLIVVISIPLSILVSIIVLARARPDAQRHDARRHGARGRHPRRRRHRRDREHPPQPGAEEAARAARSSTARSRSRCRRSSRRSASASSSCRWSSSPARRKSLFVPLAHGGRLRDDDVVPPLAHARADAGALPPRAARPTRTPREHAHAAASVVGRVLRRRSSAASSGSATSTARWLALALAHRGVVVGRLRGVRRALARRSSRSSAATSSRPSTPARSSSTSAARRARASRRPSGASPRRGDDPRGDPAERDRDDARQHRHAVSGINLSLSDGALISPADGEILIALKRAPRPTAEYVRELREELAEQFPDSTFFFLPPDIVDAGPELRPAAPIDVQVVGARGNDDATYERRAAARGAHRAGARRRRRAPRSRCRDAPELRVDVDRTHGRAARAHPARRRQRPARLALVERARSRRTSGSTRSAACSTCVAVQTPQYRDRLARRARHDAARRPAARGAPQLLVEPRDDVAHDRRRPTSRTTTSRRTFDVQANVEGADLGSVADGVDERRRRAAGRRCPRGTTIAHQGPGREHGVVVPRPRLRPRLRGRSSSTC